MDSVSLELDPLSICVLFYKVDTLYCEDAAYLPHGRGYTQVFDG